jgi:DNA end-binding protein Ku
MWKGTLTFGLVSVPVKLYSAVVQRSVRFHLLHATDNARIVQQRVCAADGDEVPFSEVVRGYEIAPGRHVVIEPEEFAALEPAFTRTIEIEDFVELEEIDNLYFDRPYYVVPNRGGARAYRLLLEAMRDTEKVAIGRVVLRSRQQLVAIFPREDLLVMMTMNFADEIQDVIDLHELWETEVDVGEHELEVAHRLVESVARPFDIANYRDTYREALLDLIDRKASGEQVALEPPARDQPLESPDLMSALEASVEQARARRAREETVLAGTNAGPPAPKQRSRTAGKRAGASTNGAKGGPGTAANGAKGGPGTAANGANGAKGGPGTAANGANGAKGGSGTATNGAGGSGTAANGANGAPHNPPKQKAQRI